MRTPTNKNSGSAISEVFTDNTIRYRGLNTRGFFDLRNNFYESLDAGLEILKEAVQDQFSSSQPDQQNFLSLSLHEPDASDMSAHNRWLKHVTLYRLLLWKAGFPLGSFPNRLQMPLGDKAASDMYTALGKDTGATNEAARAAAIKVEYGDPSRGLTFEKMESLLLDARRAHLAMLRNNTKIGLRSSSGSSWFDQQAISLSNLLARKNDADNYINGFNRLSVAIDYHSGTGSKNVPQDVYEHLKAGRIVILDLAVGSGTVRKILAEKIAAYILRYSSNEFNNGGTPPSIVVYVEEAHNLIGKDAELDETWPRIAKEGAKFGISLVYSTQEPSSIHPNIMANTENLFVTHLNNDKEVDVLSKYYDFSDFTASIKKAQDVGFARVKTLSASFVVPTMIAKFDPAVIKGVYDGLARPVGFTAAPIPAMPPASQGANTARP